MLRRLRLSLFTTLTLLFAALPAAGRDLAPESVAERSAGLVLDLWLGLGAFLAKLGGTIISGG